MASNFFTEFDERLATKTRPRPKVKGTSPEPAWNPTTYPWKAHGKPRKVHKALGKKVKTTMAGNT